MMSLDGGEEEGGSDVGGCGRQIAGDAKREFSKIWGRASHASYTRSQSSGCDLPLHYRPRP